MANVQKEFVLSKQLLRSGSSVGANIEESQYAQSKLDFISKLSIALKEANEARYWILLLHESAYLHRNEKEKLLPILNEIIAMLIQSVKTVKSARK